MGHTPIVQELVDECKKNPAMQQDLQDSFTMAKSTGLSLFADYNIETLEDYIDYLDQYVYWVPTENRTGRSVYEHICLFYFVIDLPPVSKYQNPIMPDQKSPWLWLSEWLIRYAKEMGSWMATPESITLESIQTFYEAPDYRMQDYPVPPGGWKCFNDFFARHIDPNLRPIARPDDDKVIVSPADCAFDGVWDVRDPEADVNTFDVKGVPWNISQLLEDTSVGPAFKGGKFTHSFLGPTDYHRQHAPVSGRVVEAKVIPGICYLEVVLRESASRRGGVELGMHRYLRKKDDQDLPQRHRAIPLPERRAPGVEAPDSPGYQFLQARGLIVIDNPVLGLVAVLPIGMAQVSSVVLSVKNDDYVKKGDEISCFQFGGSDIVMVFQEKANVTFNQNIGEHYNVGTHVATANPK
jgi:phosphatidylserine decarboxylase